MLGSIYHMTLKQLKIASLERKHQDFAIFTQEHVTACSSLPRKKCG